MLRDGNKLAGAWAAQAKPRPCAGTGPPSGQRGGVCLDRGALRGLGGCRLLHVLPVALQKLVDQCLLSVAARADERWERVALELDDRHLCAIKAIPVGDLQQAGVAAGVGLEPGCQHLEQLVDEVLLLRGGTLSNSTTGGGGGWGTTTTGGHSRWDLGRGGGGGGGGVLTVSQKFAMRMARSLVSPSLAYSMSCGEEGGRAVRVPRPPAASPVPVPVQVPVRPGRSPVRRSPSSHRPAPRAPRCAHAAPAPSRGCAAGRGASAGPAQTAGALARAR